jgi:3-dehydrosphinganine reductase
LRAELKPHGIRVSIVFPPDVDTPQLAYESQFRPPETRALVEGLPVLSSQAVAATILRGVSRGQYAILPGPVAKVLYGLILPLGNLTDHIMDWIVTRTQHSTRKNR